MIATSSATASAMSAAKRACIRTTPRRTNSVSSGSAAKIEDAKSESPTGSKTWVYTASSPWKKDDACRLPGAPPRSSPEHEGHQSPQLTRQILAPGDVVVEDPRDGGRFQEAVAGDGVRGEHLAREGDER